MSPNAITPFALRPPSIAWEQAALEDHPNTFAWIWYKPPSLPTGLIVTIPAETWIGLSAGSSLTMRGLLRAASVDPESVSLWYLFGVPYSPSSVPSAFDQAILPPAPGANSNIAVLLHAGGSEVTVAPGISQLPGISPAAALELAPYYDGIENDWNAARQVEKQMVLVRKQLAAMLGRLSALDRDLSPEERLHGDRQEKNDWQEARRWLKDVSVKLTRYMKEYDTGDTSAAGKKEWFEQTYEQVILPRRAIDNLQQVAKEFDGYRKRLQVLLSNMTMAHANAAQEGERRAQQVLNRLAARVRTARTKRKWA